MSDTPELIPRHKVLAFYGVPETVEGVTTVTFHRMRFFTNIAKNKNPQDYTRKYTDEKSQRSDIVSYAETISATFDRHSGDPVHEDIIDISDRELVGSDAKREIIWVQVDTGKAVKRTVSVVPNSEGSDANTYTQSADFRAGGEPAAGTASSSDDWMTATFTPEGG